MKKYLSIVAAVLVIALAAMALVSCGAPASSGAPQSETPSDVASEAPAESAAASEAPSESAAASEAPAESGEATTTGATPNVDRIKAAGKIIMLTNAAFPPYEYVGDDNKPVGVDIEIGQAIADELGVELEVVDMDFDGIIGAVQAGKGDFAAAGMTIDEDRLKNVDFSIEYATSSQFMIVKSDNEEIKEPADLKGKNVGVQGGTTGQYFAEDETEATVNKFKTALDAAMALKAGKLDAVIIDELPARAIIAKNPELKIIENKLTEEDYAMAIAKGSDDLAAVINKVLDKMIADGQIEELTMKHNVVE